MDSPAQQPSGLFLFDKPRGITSHDAVYLLRRKLSIKKIGHSGTLDPMATGLLILLVGAATRSQAALQGSAKVYGGTMRFGAETDTWDAEGEVVAEAPVPSFEPLALAVEPLHGGKIVQQVPPYSAVKVGGRKLYAMARRDEAVPEVRREVEVRWLSFAARPPELDFEIECSGGTYIRSIACELGRAMGSRAHLSALRRLSIGGYSVKDAVDPARLASMSRSEALAALRPAPGGAGA